jgi:hypothetical protein
MAAPTPPTSPPLAAPPLVSQAQRTREAREAFEASVRSVGKTLDADLQARAANIHSNAKELSKQEKALEKDIKKLSKQSDTMGKTVEKMGRDLKLAEVDDMGDILGNLEKDLAIIEETLRLAEEGDGEEEDVGTSNGHEGRARPQ